MAGRADGRAPQGGEKKPLPVHRTFQMPKRKADLLDGGSLYWVIKGIVQVRQPLADIVEGTREDGTPCCLLVLKNELIPVRPVPRRAFQGWRYLNADEAPADLGGARPVALPLCRPSCARIWQTSACCVSATRGDWKRCGASIAGASLHVVAHERCVLVHPALQELGAGFSNAAVGVEEAVFCLHEGLRLAERGHVEVGQDVAQVLLRERGADRANRDADDAGWLAAPGALAIGPRSVIERVLEYARDRTIVLGVRNSRPWAAFTCSFIFFTDAAWFASSS